MSTPAVRRVPLGSQGLIVSAQGLGLMGMSQFYGKPKPDEENIKLIQDAVELGVTFLDTADVYGPHTNEVLLGKALKGLDRDKVQVATKFANLQSPTGWTVRGDPEYVHEACNASLQRLGIDYIDLYYQHRVDTTVPIEMTVRAMKELVEAGKVKYLGLSEASPDTIRRAHAVHPISALQIEWSLWTRDVEKQLVPLCRELGIGIVPYSPLGRGFFGGKGVVEALGSPEEGDLRGVFGRFSAENLAKNRVFYDRLKATAEKYSSTPAQLALAWVQHQGKDVVPIPGTTRLENLKANIGALSINLTDAEAAEIAALVPEEEVAGPRYPEMFMKRTWEFADTPPLEEYQKA